MFCFGQHLGLWFKLPILQPKLVSKKWSTALEGQHDLDINSSNTTRLLSISGQRGTSEQNLVNKNTLQQWPMQAVTSKIVREKLESSIVMAKSVAQYNWTEELWHYVLSPPTSSQQFNGGPLVEQVPNLQNCKFFLPPKCMAWTSSIQHVWFASGAGRISYTLRWKHDTGRWGSLPWRDNKSTWATGTIQTSFEHALLIQHRWNLCLLDSTSLKPLRNQNATFFNTHLLNRVMFYFKPPHVRWHVW